VFSFFRVLMRRPPGSPLFPYTTLFRSGRIEPENSFTFEFPPYSQDLSDAGKGPSYGWGFTNSFCSERYVGGIERGRPPFEAGCSDRKSTRLNSSHVKISYAVFCLKKKK